MYFLSWWFHDSIPSVSFRRSPADELNALTSGPRIGARNAEMGEILIVAGIRRQTQVP